MSFTTTHFLHLEDKQVRIKVDQPTALWHDPAHGTYVVHIDISTVDEDGVRKVVHSISLFMAKPTEDVLQVVRRLGAEVYVVEEKNDAIPE